MVSDAEWSEAIAGILKSSPNATRRELVDALIKKFGKAEATTGERLSNFAESQQTASGSRYVMRATPRDAAKGGGGGRGGGGGGSGQGSAPPESSGGGPTSPPEPERRAPTAAQRLKFIGEENAIVYAGDDPKLAGTKWYIREDELAQSGGIKSAETEPWSVVFPNGDRWDIEIPTNKAKENYEPRGLIGGKTDVAFVQSILDESGGSALMIGHAGVGKTASIAAAAGDADWHKNQEAGTEPWRRPRLYRAVMANLSYEKLVGQYIPNDNVGRKLDDGSVDGNQFRWQDGILTKMVLYGGVFIADEINFTQADVLVSLNSLLDNDRTMAIPEHQGRIVHAHHDFRLFATMNPVGYGYVGTKPLNIALKSRFRMVFWYDWSPETEQKVIRPSSEIVPGLKAAAIHRMFAVLRDAFRKSELHYPPGLRDMKNLVANIRKFGSVEPAIISFLLLYDDPRERTKAWLRIRDQIPRELVPNLYSEDSANAYS